MGNTADKSSESASGGYSCDTLAREITFKQYRSSSDHTSGGSSDESNTNSYNDRERDRRKPLVHQSSIRRRKDLRASYRKARGDDGKKSAAAYKLSDMEVQCVDGKVCRLVPRDSAKQRLRKKASRSNSKSAKKVPVKSRPAIKPDSFEEHPPPKPALPPRTKEPQKRLLASEIWQLNTQPDILKCEKQQKPDLPPKRKNNNDVKARSSMDHLTKNTVNLNNNRINTKQTSAGLWGDKRLHAVTDLSYPIRSSPPDVARCADLSQRLNRMKLVSPISDV